MRPIVAAVARADLAASARHTQQDWGGAQKRRFLNLLRLRLANLRQHPELGQLAMMPAQDHEASRRAGM